MNVVVWNCRGALGANFKTAVMELVRIHQPAMMIITETKVGNNRAKEITDLLPFDGALHADTVGYAGGIWLLWFTDLVDISQLASTEQEIHALVQVKSSNTSWIISAIYASPRYVDRRLLWDNLTTVASLHNLPWIMLGDFNEMLNNSEKFGGLPINIGRALKFKACLDACGMIDLGFSGPKFTWSNRREVNGLIQERLDKCFANLAWRNLYPEAQVHHLTMIHSDHCPILLCLEKDQDLNLPRPFRFQSMWLSHPSFPNLVKDSWSLNSNSITDNIKSFTMVVKN
nr:uncharacterized protein LOC111990725 [Quercus suber]